MDVATLVIIAIIVLAIVGVWLLPTRKRWNDDGADDLARTDALFDEESE